MNKHNRIDVDVVNFSFIFTKNHSFSFSSYVARKNKRYLIYQVSFIFIGQHNLEDETFFFVNSFNKSCYYKDSFVINLNQVYCTKLSRLLVIFTLL